MTVTQAHARMSELLIYPVDGQHVVEVTFPTHSFSVRLTDEELKETETDLSGVLLRHHFNVKAAPHWIKIIKRYRGDFFETKKPVVEVKTEGWTKQLPWGNFLRLIKPDPAQLIQLGLDIAQVVPPGAALSSFLTKTENTWTIDLKIKQRRTYHIKTPTLERICFDLRDIPDEYREEVQKYTPSIDELQRAARGELTIPVSILAPGVSVTYGLSA